MAERMLGAEPVTARRATRQKFIECEVQNMQIYIDELSMSLSTSKQILQELLAARYLSTSQTIDRSYETEVSSHVSQKMLEKAIQDNIELFNQLRRTRQEEEFLHGRSLIAEQIAEEERRKEVESINELEDELHDLKYLMEKKFNRIRSLEEKIGEYENKLRQLQQECAILLPLTDESLMLHKEVEKLKAILSNESKQLFCAEMQRDELVQHYKELETQAAKYRILAKNPMTKAKRSNHSAFNVLEVSFDNHRHQPESEDSESSSEVCFPDKVSIESKLKPRLPKLDLTKLNKRAPESDISKNPNMYKVRSRMRELEKLCKEKTEELNNLREVVSIQEESNRKQVAELRTLQERLRKNESGYPNILAQDISRKAQRRKRALSNALEYVRLDKLEVQESPLKTARIDVTLDLEDPDQDLILSPNDVSSFCASEVMKMYDEEPDSVLVDYINEISF
jgi:hypothetical protein